MFRFLLWAAVIASAAACESATAPHAAPAPAYGAVVEKGPGVYTIENELFDQPCLGEIVRFDVQTNFTYHFVTTPTGTVVFVANFRMGQTTGTMTGLTSGTVWTPARLVSPGVDRIGRGEVHTFTANQWWVSETGPTVHVHTRFHLTVNANGELTVEHDDFQCRLR